MRVWLIRHAQTAFNIERRFLGWTDVPLDAAGEEQTELLAQQFRYYGFPDRVYSSPLKRAMQTAAVLGAPVPIPELREMNMGALEGKTREEIEAASPESLHGWFHDPANFRCPGGETLEELQDRMLAAMARIRRREKRILGGLQGRTIAVVSHQLAITALLCAVKREPLSSFRKFSHGNTGMSDLDWERGRLRVVKLNETSHLTVP